jgi:hypothetical protein
LRADCRRHRARRVQVQQCCSRGGVAGGGQGLERVERRWRQANQRETTSGAKGAGEGPAACGHAAGHSPAGGVCRDAPPRVRSSGRTGPATPPSAPAQPGASSQRGHTTGQHRTPHSVVCTKQRPCACTGACAQSSRRSCLPPRGIRTPRTGASSAVSTSSRRNPMNEMTHNTGRPLGVCHRHETRGRCAAVMTWLKSVVEASTNGAPTDGGLSPELRWAHSRVVAWRCLPLGRRGC